ncbi:MAG: hypothetical protein IK082_03365 [Oscillospiraceae bacterium]|nr:hypothetical protein [Oscillospiraceae bacterium]
MTTMNIDSYEEIRDRLRIRLMDLSSNEEKLENVIWEPAGCGFALAAYMEIPDEAGENGVANVPRAVAHALGIEERTIMQDAMEGSASHVPAKLSTMRSALFGPPENLLAEKEKKPLEGTDFLVLTTEDGRLGASALCYPEMTRRLGEIVGGDYFVLPSSVHEVLILPDRGNLSPNDLLLMVMEVNEAEVLPEDRLADRVMHFRTDLQKLQVAAEPGRDRDRGEERG